MNLNTTTRNFSNSILNIPTLYINTGRKYGEDQVVIANVVEVTPESYDSIWNTVKIQIVDDSRCVYETVSVHLNWVHIKMIQEDTKTEKGIASFSRKIMEQYDNGNYC